MKLLVEVFDTDYLVEEVNGRKQYFIEGIFMQSDEKNRNGRIYPKDTLEAQVDAYQNVIKGRKSTGELGHPSNPSINLDRVSHLITSLKVEGKNIIGKAKVLDTPMGKITKALMDEDIQLGVSSRGLGSLKESKAGKIVQPDFILTTVDIVADPSAHDAWVENLVENTEWFLEGTEWKLKEAVNDAIVKYKQDKKDEREQKFLKAFSSLFKAY